MCSHNTAKAFGKQTDEKKRFISNNICCDEAPLEMGVNVCVRASVCVSSVVSLSLPEMISGGRRLIMCRSQAIVCNNC